MVSLSEKQFLHAFNMVEGMHPAALRSIYGHFGEFSRAWICGTVDDFLEAGLTHALSQKIDAGRIVIDPHTAFEAFLAAGYFLDLIREKEYPFRLKSIPEAPLALYRRGPPVSNHPAVALVGSRTPSSYGVGVARELSKRLALCNTVIVSGLAFGIDAAAHEGAVEAHGKTVAVLASGIKKITPSSNVMLAEKIVQNGGTIYSEYPTDEFSYKGRFLERNRIISGIACATVVIEAKKQSGALTTAQYATEQNRELFAVPGDICRPQAAGCLKLISDAQARPLIDIGGFIMELGLDEQVAARGRLTREQKKIIACVLQGPCDFDTLAQKTAFPPYQLNTQLTLLELQKMVTKNQHGEWIAP